MTGAVPGAKIDVLEGAQQVGAATADKGWAGVVYDAGSSAAPLAVKEITCNNLAAQW